MHIYAEQVLVQQERVLVQHGLLWYPKAATTWSVTNALLEGGMVIPFHITPG